MTKSTEKRFTSSTAQITADRGEFLKADIMQTGETICHDMYVLRDEIRTAYWKLHSELATTGFDDKSKQTAAAAKLGQLAIAMESIEQAYSAVNAVRCW